MPCRRLTRPLAHSARDRGRTRSRVGSSACAAQRPHLGLASRIGAAGGWKPRHHLHQPLPQVEGFNGEEGGGRGKRGRAPRAAPHSRVRRREEEAAYLRARQYNPPAPTAPQPPAGGELSLLAAQLRALADSLSPPTAAAAAAPVWPWPEAEAAALSPGPPDAAWARLLGNALEGAGPTSAHAHYAPCPHQ